MKINMVYQIAAMSALILGSMHTGCKDKEQDQKAGQEPDVTMIMGRYGCYGCHSLDGSGFRGPSFKGLFGRTSILKSGDTVLVDEAYIRKSILDPSADMVLGYPMGLMPAFEPTPDEMDLMVEYLKEFKFETVETK